MSETYYLLKTDYGKQFYYQCPKLQGEWVSIKEDADQFSRSDALAFAGMISKELEGGQLLIVVNNDTPSIVAIFYPPG